LPPVTELLPLLGAEVAKGLPPVIELPDVPLVAVALAKGLPPVIDPPDEAVVAAEVGAAALGCVGTTTAGADGLTSSKS
jgi:hypothetical protein